MGTGDERMPEVIVVGGGLAGLVAARHLAAGGADVTVLERRDAVGGRVRSERVDGFTLDRGFQVLFTGYPAVQRELDLDALDLRPFTQGATVANGDRQSEVTDPLRDPRGIPGTLFSDALTLGDAWRLFRLRRELVSGEPEALLTAADTTIREYLAKRGFSDRFVERFVAPFYGGITLDRSLSTSSALFRYTFRMLTTGETAVPASGMGAVPAQLATAARDAGAEMRTGVDVTAVAAHAEDGGEAEVTVEAGGETRDADAAVVATDPATARDLTGVSGIPTASRGCVTQHFALPRTQRLHLRHPLVLNAADDRPNQVAVMSDVARTYAPKGMQLLSATFLGTPEKSDDALAAAVTAALDEWFPENRFENLELLWTHRIDHAQHAQPPGSLASVPRVDDPEGSVFLAGDYTRWSSIQGALESGRRAASAVVGD
jgi:phytoene dehydrogenase-like protein